VHVPPLAMLRTTEQPYLEEAVGQAALDVLKLVKIAGGELKKPVSIRNSMLLPPSK
jgi:hypothetical protein